MAEFRPIAGVCGRLLESPVWDARRSRVFCCDIDGRRILEFDLQDGLAREWSFETEVASLGLCESGRLVVALRREVVLFDPETGARSPLWSGFDEPEGHRLNDGKVGPDGAFWVGGMSGGPDFPQESNLYRITADGTAQIAATGLRIANGLAWSPDGQTMFHSDSRATWVDTHDFDAGTGAMSNRRRIRMLDEESGRPDGGTCDLDGFYWSAGVSAGVINRLAPDGALDRTIAVPVASPTSASFCGPDLDHLVITSHRNLPPDRFEAAPLSGTAIVAKLSMPGHAPWMFGDGGQ